MEERVVFGSDGLQALIDVLADDGVDVFGPRVERGVIAVGPIRSVDDLPIGWTDEQAPGRYGLHFSGGTARFSWAVGPQSWKPLLHPPRLDTMTITDPRDADRVQVRPHRSSSPRRAFLGVRPCELAAIAVQDTVLRDADRPDHEYQQRRRDLFLVVVNCTAPAATCFCSSMGTGPCVNENSVIHDLELTELVRPDADPLYLARSAGERGAAVLEQVAARCRVAPADVAAVDREANSFDEARAAMATHLDTDGLREVLLGAVDDPAWDSVADRCVACANCTAVCPTCFCTSPNDVTDLEGVVHRSRVWDSCFDLEFSRVGPQPMRASVAARYRQWLLHKLSTWHDQFGGAGCVGCGRCITWCPVGIDLTAEAETLREQAGAGAPT